MSRWYKFGISLVATVVLVFMVGTSKASAQYPSVGIGIHMGHNAWGHSMHSPLRRSNYYSRSYRSRVFSPRVYRSYSVRPWYHDTSHYDYHAPQLVPHGNHFDYVPGHYDLHRTGHWHW